MSDKTFEKRSNSGKRRKRASSKELPTRNTPDSPKNLRRGASQESQNPPVNTKDLYDTGLELEVYAQAHGTYVGEVWRRIRSGLLIARPENGKLLVYENNQCKPVDSGLKLSQRRSGLQLGSPTLEAGFEPEPDLHRQAASREDRQELPNPDLTHSSEPFTIPSAPEDIPIVKSSYESRAPALERNKQTPGTLPPSPTGLTQENSVILSDGFAKSPEIALLLDHLSLAKEENRELLKLTQDTVKKVTEMSENIVSMKDDVIRSKESQIEYLSQKLNNQQQQIQKLNQENEDFAMLAKTMSREK